MSKTVEEINRKVSRKKAVVLTAEEMIDVVEKKGAKQAAEHVDVVTTGTFGAMCSSGAYFNITQSTPKIKIGGGICTLNDVPAYAGFAAADIMLGCSQVHREDAKNRMSPGRFLYGGGHVIEEFVAGKDITLRAEAYGTDCYPSKELKQMINKENVRSAVLFNPRNCYQNYNVAVNAADTQKYTYMGVLKPNFANATYSSAGQLSPLMNDPFYRTIGIGTRLFLGGSTGYVSWPGTQHSPNAPRDEKGIPLQGAGTLALTGDLTTMTPRWLRGVSLQGYGVSLMIGIGIPIPILDAEMARYTAVKDEEIYAPVIDYGTAYQRGAEKPLKRVSYAELRSGLIRVGKRDVPTASLSSYAGAREIAEILKGKITRGEFLLTQPVAHLPGAKKNGRQS